MDRSVFVYSKKVEKNFKDEKHKEHRKENTRNAIIDRKVDSEDFIY